MNLDNMPVTPQIRVIDSYMSNRKLGLLFEAAVERAGCWYAAQVCRARWKIGRHPAG